MASDGFYDSSNNIQRISDKGEHDNGAGYDGGSYERDAGGFDTGSGEQLYDIEHRDQWR